MLIGVGPAKWSIRLSMTSLDFVRDLMLEIEVTSVPTLILFMNGIEVSRSVGLEPQKIKEMAESAIEKEFPHG